ncbi:MAG: hypothetical protein ABIP38_06005 [Steroidobacteraceae bacterium]
MTDKKPGKQPEEDTSDQNQDVHSQGTRKYEGGKNPDMKSQRSNRQGDGRPTQQRTEDR